MSGGDWMWVAMALALLGLCAMAGGLELDYGGERQRRWAYWTYGLSAGLLLGAVLVAGKASGL